MFFGEGGGFYASIELTLVGILSFREPPECFCGLENVNKASINIVVL